MRKEISVYRYGDFQRREERYFCDVCGRRLFSDWFGQDALYQVDVPVFRRYSDRDGRPLEGKNYEQLRLDLCAACMDKAVVLSVGFRGTGLSWREDI